MQRWAGAAARGGRVAGSSARVRVVRSSSEVKVGTQQALLVVRDALPRTSAASEEREVAPAGDEALQGSSSGRQRDQHGQGAESAQSVPHACAGPLVPDVHFHWEDGGDGRKGDGAHEACGRKGVRAKRVCLGGERWACGQAGSGSSLVQFMRACTHYIHPPTHPPVMTLKNGIKQATNCRV